MGPVKYALVTGASSGIGWHISELLASAGYSIVAVSNQPVELTKLKQYLETSYIINVHTLNIDLSDSRAAKEVYDFCKGIIEEIDVLVNNAGVLITGEILLVPSKDVKGVLQLHMMTTTLLCQLFGRKMTERRSGFILNVSSISSVMPYPWISLYGPTKTYIRSFTRALRTEMKPCGVKVTCLLPGATATSLFDKQNINVPLAIKLGVMKRPAKVAQAGLKALFNDRAECIPGFLNKLVVFLFPLIPHFMIVLIYKRARLKEQNKDV